MVGLPLSKHFTDIISMDLKEINDHKILHMVDHVTWFSSAPVVKSKHKEEIVKATFQHWIVLGPPNQTLSDNWGEFNNKLLREMSDQLNILVRSMTWISLVQSRIERQNVNSGNMISKLLFGESNKYPIEIIVAYAVSAKDALHNYYGYSPNQLVFGKNLQCSLINHQP